MLEFVLPLVVQLVAAGAIYGGIRADLRHCVASASEAHRRIDALMARGVSR